MKRKRSRVSRRPRANSESLYQNYFGWLSLVEPLGKQAENENIRDTTVASDGLGTDNKTKKLKLKLGGVTHIIHAKSKTEIGCSGGSFMTNFSPCSDGHMPQDDSDGNELLKPVRAESGFTAENHSHRREITGESINVNYEHAHKSKRTTRRCALGVGFSDEVNEDAELHFPETFNASKQAVSCHRDNRGGSIKDAKNKLNLDKKYEDWDYVDESISERKKPKRESVDLLVRGKESTLINRNQSVDSFKDVLSGSDASIVDISDGLVPMRTKREKGKLSEKELHLKKAEAAQRRKIQSEKAAREAEVAAIRKILGHDSGRKKKEEKMNKRRDELFKEKSSKYFNLGSNTVRLTMGPQGTVVTFSEDIGLPSIFQMIPNSYPPPREKCAGPNCTNVYKYRDSKSKLPLCSLDCYRAIHERMQPVVTC